MIPAVTLGQTQDQLCNQKPNRVIWQLDCEKKGEKAHEGHTQSSHNKLLSISFCLSLSLYLFQAEYQTVASHWAKVRVD